MTRDKVAMGLLGPGAVVAGRYQLVRRIGRGAMGVVFEAKTVADGARVAVKLMRSDLLSEARAVHRFEREARLSSRLTSKHVVRTIDAGVDSALGVPWISMELVPHGHLADWVEARDRVDPALVGAILHQVFDAVAEAHRAGVVHRDLKPENVLVADPGGSGEPPKVKVSDFGVAKGLTDTSMSATEAGLGTPLWTSPEQAREGYVPTARSDVWALGLISYWLLAGRQYWRAANERGGVLGVIMEMQQSDFSAPSQRAREQGVGERIPPGFDDWFRRAVVRDVDARFADAGEAWPVLADVLLGRPRPLGPAAPASGDAALASRPEAPAAASDPDHAPSRDAPAAFAPVRSPLRQPAAERSSHRLAIVSGLAVVLVLISVLVWLAR